ncbi:hypothetical protein Chor_011708, partial [Crotalus horridus]
DPRKNRLFQWNDVKLNMGLTQLSFPLSSEPALGTYKLVIEKSSRKIAGHTFHVEEYVLPKFKVSVTGPKQISVWTGKFEITICGKYTYGKPVPGLVKMAVCRRYTQHNPCPETELNLCEEYSGEMKLVDGMDVPMANKTIQITGPSVKYTARHTTNEEGRIQVVSFPFYKQGVYKENEWCHNSVPIYHRHASHLVYRFYSPSQSYLHIEPLPKTLSCGDTEQIRVHFILDPNAVKKEIIFHYLVKPKGDFLLNLSVDVDTAPVTRLLLYTILPNGELVAHSRDFTVEKCFSNKKRQHRFTALQSNKGPWNRPDSGSLIKKACLGKKPNSILLLPLAPSVLSMLLTRASFS